MINFRVYEWLKSMLSVTLGKNCGMIKSMSSIIEFISLNIQITKELLNVKGPYVCQNVLRPYLILKELKHVYFCVLISIFAFTMRSVIAFMYI